VKVRYLGLKQGLEVTSKGLWQRCICHLTCFM